MKSYTLLLGVVCLLGMSILSSEAKPRHYLTTSGQVPVRVAPQDNTANRLLRVAQRDVGAAEGSSRPELAARTAGLKTSVGRRNAWCAAMVSLWLKEAGYSRVHPRAAVDDLYSELDRLGQSTRPVPGAVVFFTWSHVGVVLRVQADGSIVTLEGNHQNRVAVVTRRRSQIRECFVL